MSTPAPTPTHLINNQEFLETIFGDAWERATVTAFDGDPNTADSLWNAGAAGRRLKHFRETQNTYFTLSLFKDEARRLTDWRALYVLGVDDVGAGGNKVDADKVLALLGEPTWRLETSPGNEQWGYVLDPPLTHGDGAEALQDAVKDALVGVGAPDPGMKDLNRYFRLPVGTNQKPTLVDGPFRNVLLSWRPDLRRGHDWVDQILQAKSLVFDWSIHALSTKSRGSKGRPLTQKEWEQASQDGMLRALHVLGLVQGAHPGSPMGEDTVHITCPWAATEHTHGGVSGTAYTPLGRAFKCHHGHCLGRNYGDLRDKVDALLKEESGGLVGLAAMEFEAIDPASVSLIQFADPVAAWVSDTVYLSAEARQNLWSVSDQIRLHDDAHNERWSPRLAGLLPEAANSTPKTPKFLSPAQWYRQHPERRRAVGFIHWPGGEALTEREGKLLVNRWREKLVTLVPRTVTDDEVRPWLALAHHVLGIGTLDQMQNCELVLDWQAMVVGSWTKPGWFPLLIGPQGLGKDGIALPVREALGGMATEIAGGEVGSAFNPWAVKRFVVVNEIRQTSRGQLTPHDQNNALKLWDNTREAVVINAKYEAPYEARNVACLWLTSNERTPVRLEQDDRRVMVLDSLGVPVRKDLLDAYWAWVKQVDAEGFAGWQRVHTWLIQRWEGMDDYRKDALVGRAPKSEGKDAMLDTTRDEVEVWMEDTLARSRGEDEALPDVVTTRFVMRKLTHAAQIGDGLTRHAHIPNERMLGRLLGKLGCQVLNGGMQVSVKGTRLRLWSVRDHSLYASLRSDALAKVVEQLVGSTGLSDYVN